MYPKKNPTFVLNHLSNVSSVRLGSLGTFGAAVTLNGTLYTWGTQREVASTPEPTVVEFPSEEATTITSYDCADKRNCTLQKIFYTPRHSCN